MKIHNFHGDYSLLRQQRGVEKQALETSLKQGSPNMSDEKFYARDKIQTGREGEDIQADERHQPSKQKSRKKKETGAEIKQAEEIS